MSKEIYIYIYLFSFFPVYFRGCFCVDENVRIENVRAFVTWCVLRTLFCIGSNDMARLKSEKCLMENALHERYIVISSGLCEWKTG